jgi:hypothetical protein
MCRIASLFLSQRLKESMSGDAHDFNIETLAIFKNFFLQSKASKKIHVKWQLIRHSRPPEDGNHMPQHVGVDSERINSKNSTTLLVSGVFVGLLKCDTTRCSVQPSR